MRIIKQYAILNALSFHNECFKLLDNIQYIYIYFFSMPHQSPINFLNALRFLEETNSTGKESGKINQPSFASSIREGQHVHWWRGNHASLVHKCLNGWVCVRVALTCVILAWRVLQSNAAHSQCSAHSQPHWLNTWLPEQVATLRAKPTGYPLVGLPPHFHWSTWRMYCSTVPGGSTDIMKQAFCCF